MKDYSHLRRAPASPAATPISLVEQELERTQELVHRPVVEDEPELIQDGNQWTARSSRKIGHEVLEAKERVPLSVFKKPKEGQVRYFVKLALRLRQNLDLQQFGPQHERAMNRKMRRANHVQPKVAKRVIDEQRKENRMARVLESRLSILADQVNAFSGPAYHSQGPEALAFANGVRFAHATMSGNDFQPIAPPAAASADVPKEQAPEQLEPTTPEVTAEPAVAPAAAPAEVAASAAPVDAKAAKAAKPKKAAAAKAPKAQKKAPKGK